MLSMWLLRVPRAMTKTESKQFNRFCSCQFALTCWMSNLIESTSKSRAANQIDLDWTWHRSTYHLVCFWCRCWWSLHCFCFSKTIIESYASWWNFVVPFCKTIRTGATHIHPPSTVLVSADICQATVTHSMFNMWQKLWWETSKKLYMQGCMPRMPLSIYRERIAHIGCLLTATYAAPGMTSTG